MRLSSAIIASVFFVAALAASAGCAGRSCRTSGEEDSSALLQSKVGVQSKAGVLHRLATRVTANATLTHQMAQGIGMNLTEVLSSHGYDNLDHWDREFAKSSPSLRRSNCKDLADDAAANPNSYTTDDQKDMMLEAAFGASGGAASWLVKIGNGECDGSNADTCKEEMAREVVFGVTDMAVEALSMYNPVAGLAATFAVGIIKGLWPGPKKEDPFKKVLEKCKSMIDEAVLRQRLDSVKTDMQGIADEVDFMPDFLKTTETANSHITQLLWHLNLQHDLSVMTRKVFHTSFDGTKGEVVFQLAFLNLFGETMATIGRLEPSYASGLQEKLVELYYEFYPQLKTNFDHFKTTKLAESGVIWWRHWECPFERQYKYWGHYQHNICQKRGGDDTQRACRWIDAEYDNWGDGRPGGSHGRRRSWQRDWDLKAVNPQCDSWAAEHTQDVATLIDRMQKGVRQINAATFIQHAGWPNNIETFSKYAAESQQQCMEIVEDGGAYYWYADGRECRIVPPGSVLEMKRDYATGVNVQAYTFTQTKCSRNQDCGTFLPRSAGYIKGNKGTACATGHHIHSFEACEEAAEEFFAGQVQINPHQASNCWGSSWNTGCFWHDSSAGKLHWCPPSAGNSNHARGDVWPLCFADSQARNA